MYIDDRDNPVEQTIETDQELDAVIKKGCVLTIEAEYYSDRHTLAIVLVKKDFCKKDVVRDFLREHKHLPRGKYREGELIDEFAPWLTRNGYIEAIDDEHTWNIGAYHCFMR